MSEQQKFCTESRIIWRGLWTVCTIILLLFGIFFIIDYINLIITMGTLNLLYIGVGIAAAMYIYYLVYYKKKQARCFPKAFIARKKVLY